MGYTGKSGGRLIQRRIRTRDQFHMGTAVHWVIGVNLMHNLTLPWIGKDENGILIYFHRFSA